LALTEELGGALGYDGKAFATTGAQLLNQADVSPIRNATIAQLMAQRRLDPGAVYLIVADPSSYHRYRSQLALHFMPKSIRVLHNAKPWVIEVHTQIDYFNNTALGIPTDQLELAHHLGLLAVPRFQNDERFEEPQMNALFGGVLKYDPKV